MRWLLILLLPVFLSAQVIIQPLRYTAVDDTNSGTIIVDDFSTDPFISRWTDDLGTASWNETNETVSLNGTGSIVYHNTEMTGTDYYVKVKWSDITQYYSGILFRYESAGGTGYVVRYNGNDIWAWRDCIDASCNDIETVTLSTPPYSTAFYAGIYVSGTGNNTEVSLWIGTTPMADDYSQWGTPNHIFTNNPGRTRDSGKLVGIYEGGGGSTPTFDDFYAEDE